MLNNQFDFIKDFCSENKCGRGYSSEFRSKVIERIYQGSNVAKEACRTGVSYPTIKRWLVESNNELKKAKKVEYDTEFETMKNKIDKLERTISNQNNFFGILIQKHPQLFTDILEYLNNELVSEQNDHSQCPQEEK